MRMNSHTVSLSFCITYHNEGPLLKELVEAVLTQDEAPDEILIYDDCSSLPPECLPDSNCIRVIRGEANVGPAQSRNAMLAQAAGNFIHFHDADDLLAPGWAKAVRAALADPSVDCVFCECNSEYAGRVIERSQSLSKLAESGDLLAFAISFGLFVPTGVYRTSLVRDVGGYPAYWQSEDYAFHIRLALAGPRFAIVPQPLVVIRLRPEGRSARERSRVFVDAVRILGDLRSSLPKSYFLAAGCKAFTVARNLFNLGDEKGAAEGFVVARQFCTQPWADQPAHYRLSAATFGPIAAERMGRIFRRATGRGL
jgi:glycosyltransferase involved in cell wall biosynthesis